MMNLEFLNFLMKHNKNGTADMRFNSGFSSICEKPEMAEIILAINWLKTCHTMMSRDTWAALEDAAHSSIVAEAYYDATLLWNCGRVDGIDPMIPSTAQVMENLRVLLARYEREGVKFSQGVRELVYNKH